MTARGRRRRKKTETETEHLPKKKKKNILLFCVIFFNLETKERAKPEWNSSPKQNRE